MCEELNKVCKVYQTLILPVPPRVGKESNPIDGLADMKEAT